jgi:hypothetical protein
MQLELAASEPKVHPVEMKKLKPELLLRTGREQPVAAALPVFCRVKVWALEVVPTGTPPKS